MNKKIISLVLALVMVLGTFTSVFAAEPAKKEEAKKPAASEKVEKIVGKDNKIQYIIDKKLVEGYEDGSYGLDKNIKRSEITRLLVLANGNEDLAKKLQGAMKVYSDVDTKHWANGVISVGTTVPSDANGIAMLAGYPDGSFKPENDVTYAELAKMLVVLAKKDLTADMVKNAIWATSWMRWAAELGILDDVTITDSNKAANRADAFTMVYNALYKMQEFKRVPANEKLGVISLFNKDKLVLNQDSKEQEYTVTSDTVFVRTYKFERSNVVRVKDITNPDYYLGSLVRVIVNDKKEVTHILELGNPKDMALGRPAGTYGENSRWTGVADNTVSTTWSNVNTLNTNFKTVLTSWAKIELKDNKNAVKGISFQNIVNNKVVDNGYVRVNSDTKVFVANPYNNIMRQVKDINEAMSLLGYDQARWNMIPNVYAGFDTDGHRSAIKGFDATDRNTAKVVVFNVVAKSQDGDLYRIVNQSSSLGKATLEDTAGKLYDRDFFRNMYAFPYNYGDLYDVIEVNARAAAGTDAIVTKIDHSDTKNFPIVEITRLYNDGKALEIKDEYNYRSVIDTRDADIFNAKQFKDLKVGDKVQFLNEKQSTVIDILSILPRDTKIEGSMRGIVKSVYGQTFVGTVIEAHVDGSNSTVVMDVANRIFDRDAKTGYATFYVSPDTARALKAYIGKDVNFAVTDMGGWAGRFYAANFFDEATGKKISPVEETVTVVEVKDLVTKANDAYNPNKVSATNLEDARKALKTIDDKVGQLPLDERAPFTTETEEPFGVAIKALRDQIAKFDAEARLVAAEKVLKEVNLKDLTALDSTNQKSVAQADIDKVIKDKVKAATLTGVSALQDTNITVERATGATGSAYQYGEVLTVKVVLTDATVNTVTKTVELPANVISH